MNQMHSADPPRICLLIPIYNNKDTIATVVDEVLDFGLPIIVVNDGSDEATRVALERMDGRRPEVTVHHLPKNGGKGFAVKQGLRLANERGFTHALQIDADGQHCSADIPRFLEACRECPEALILGKPIFGDDVPKARLHGRKLSQAFVWLETLSLDIADPLFGFRVYPVASSMALLDSFSMIGNRMDFDPEIAVKLYWRGVPIRNLASVVSYPEGGLSSFRMVADNIRITLMHTRLTLGMLPRVPLLLWRRLQR